MENKITENISEYNKNTGMCCILLCIIPSKIFMYTKIRHEFLFS